MARRCTSVAMNRVRDLLAAQADDASLLQRFVVARDDAAFATLVDRYGPLVMRVCRQRLSDVHAAEDAFQAAFLVLARKAACVRPESLCGWLHAVAARIAKNAQRTRSLPTAAADATPSPAVGPVAEVTLREAGAVLDEELARLPEKYRVPLVLCYLAEKTRDEAVQQLGWPEGTFKRRLERGRELLRQRLAQRGLTLSAGLVASLLSADASAAVPLAVKQAAVRIAVSKALPGATAEPIVRLAEGVLHTMPVGKSKLAFALVLVFAMSGLGAGMLCIHAWSDAPVAAVPGGGGALPPMDDRPAEIVPPRLDRFGDALPEAVLLRLGTTRLRPGFQVTALAVSPDGRRVASASGSGLHLWDMATGKEIAHLHKNDIQKACFSPDGTTLFAHDWRAILVWDAVTGKELRRIQPKKQGDDEDDGIGDFALSPDGKLLAIAGPADRITLVDVATGKTLRACRTQRQATKVAFSPDSKLLLSAGSDGKDFAMCIWDCATAQEIRSIVTPRHATSCIAFAPDGKTFASAGTLFADKQGDANSPALFVYDVATGKQLRRLTVPDSFGGYANSVAFSPDGKVLACGTGPGVIRLWDTATWQEADPLQGHGRGVHALAFARDSARLVSGGNDSTIRVWDLGTRKELHAAEDSAAWLGAAVWLADDQTIATFAGDSLRLWGGHQGAEQRRLGPIREEGSVGGSALTFSRDRRFFAAVHCQERQVRLQLWNVSEGKDLGIQQLDKLDADAERPEFAVLSPDGQRVAVGIDKHVSLWDLTTGKRLTQLRGHAGVLDSGVFSPDGKRLATGDGQGTVLLWDLASGKVLQRWSVGERDYIDCVAFSPDGQLLAAGGTNEQIHVWETASGVARRSIDVRQEGARDRSRVLCLAFSPDGRWLASGGWARNARLWEVATATEIRQLEGHRGGVMCLDFAAHGRALVTGSQDTSALVWDLHGLTPTEQETARTANARDLESHWRNLTSDKASVADPSMRLMTGQPTESLALLRQHLAPAAGVEAAVLTQLIADLESQQFDIRQRATVALEKLDDLAEPALRSLLAGQPNLETRQRAEQLLEKLALGMPPGERLRGLRAVQVLEWIGTPEAHAQLQRLAQGAAASRLTRAAQAAADRLARNGVR